MLNEWSQGAISVTELLEDCHDITMNMQMQYAVSGFHYATIAEHLRLSAAKDMYQKCLVNVVCSYGCWLQSVWSISHGFSSSWEVFGQGLVAF